MNDKERREKVNQYNLKYKGGRTEIKKDRMTILLRDAMLLKPTANGLKEDESRIEGEEKDNNIDDEYLAYLDSITEKEEYTEEAN